VKIFHLHWPNPVQDFADAGTPGTLAPIYGGHLCPECQRSGHGTVPPLVIEWLPGSDQIGDFTWSALGADVVVTQCVRDALEPRFCCLEFRPVHFAPASSGRRRTSGMCRPKPRVRLPYGGPPLWHLTASALCRVDSAQSTAKRLQPCGTCGRERWERTAGVRPHLVVDPSTWHGEDVFTLDAYPSTIFCTGQVKAFVEEQQFTNVTFQSWAVIPKGI
jgi:hypothetical protein